VEEARWADSPGVERVPFVSAVTKPSAFFARRPAAERAADARRFRSAGLPFFFKLAVWSNDQIVRNVSHAQLL